MRFVYAILAALFIFTTGVEAAVKTAVATGNWNAAIWSPTGTPVSTDSIIISNVTVTITNTVTMTNLWLSNSASILVVTNPNGPAGITVNGATTNAQGSILSLAVTNNFTDSILMQGAANSAGGVIKLYNNIQLRTPSLTVIGTGISSNGSIESCTGDNYYTNQITSGGGSMFIGVDSGTFKYGGYASASTGFQKYGAGTAILTGADGATGAHTVNAGILQLTNGASFNAIAWTINNATLDLNGQNLSVPAFGNRNIVFGNLASNYITTGTGILYVYYPNTIFTSGGNSRPYISGIVDIGNYGHSTNANTSFNVADGNTIWTVPATIQGSGDLAIYGGGTINLNGANTFTGALYISNAIVQLNVAPNSNNVAGPFGNSSAGVILGSGLTTSSSRLTFNVGGASDKIFYIGEVGESGPNNSMVFNAGVTLNGQLLPLAQGTAKNLEIRGSGCTLGGSSDNSYLRLQLIGGTSIFAKSSSAGVHALQYLWIDNTFGAGAQLAGTGGNQLYQSGAVYFTNATAGQISVLDFNGKNDRVDVLGSDVCSTNYIVCNNDGGISRFAIGESGGSGSYGGFIWNNTNGGTGKMAIVKTGTGTFTLNSTNTQRFTGGVTVSNGVLVVTNGCRLGESNNITVVQGAYLALFSSSSVIGTNAWVYLNTNSGSFITNSFNGTNYIGALFTNGVRLASGTYGSSNSPAANKINVFAATNVNGNGIWSVGNTPSPSAPVITNVTASYINPYSYYPWAILTGVISNDAGIYPVQGETVTAKIDGFPAYNGTVTNATGRFVVTNIINTIPGGRFTINYSYAGGTNLLAAPTNSSTIFTNVGGRLKF